MKEIDNAGVRFVCQTELDAWRAQTLLVKEPGTIAWLGEIVEGDVVYDVGANIGCYALLAALRVGASGHVYAFEPHVGNAASLLRNVQRNGMHDRVTVLTVCIADFVGFDQFWHAATESGSSGHQLGAALAGARELKAVTTIDALVLCGLRRPTCVKIDVDGIELRVLHGMVETLTGSLGVRPRSVQVEIPPPSRVAIDDFMRTSGYMLHLRHRTMSGAKAVAAGTDPDDVTDNAIYERAS